MTAATHYTGKDGLITIGGVETTLVDFSIDIAVGVIASGRIGKVSDKKYPGKKDITGKITQVLITGDLLAKLIGNTDDITESGSTELLAETTLTGAGSRETIDVTNDPATDKPTSVKYTLTVGNVATTAGSVVLHGTDANDNYVTEVIDFDAMEVGDAAQVKNGTQVFKTTDYLDVEAALETGSTQGTIKLDGNAGVQTLTPGTSTLFDIIGKVTDGTNYFQITANNCFFTGGNFPIADAETLVQTDLPFVIQDPDSDVTLEWLSA